MAASHMFCQKFYLFFFSRVFSLVFSQEMEMLMQSHGISHPSTNASVELMTDIIKTSGTDYQQLIKCEPASSAGQPGAVSATLPEDLMEDGNVLAVADPMLSQHSSSTDMSMEDNMADV